MIFIVEKKRARAHPRGKMSRWNYDAQSADKAFKMNAHHVPLRQIVAEIRLETRDGVRT
jgi:hypothetical protein